MATEGNNPAPVVRRSYDATRGSLYTADFFAPLRSSKSQWNASIQMLHAQQQQQQQQVPDLFSSRRWRGNKDLYWQQQQVQELLQEERMQLLKDSVLMNRNSLLAAYTYEDFPHHRPQYTAGDAAAGEAAKLTSNAAAEAAEPSCITKLGAADVGCKYTFSPSNSNNFSSNNWDSSSSSSGSSNTQGSIDRRRARLFSKMESLTSREVYAAVRCIADPEHPYTLEELAVVLPHNVKVLCCCNSNNSSSSEESVDKGMCYNCQLHELQQQQLQQQQQQHWRRKENLRVEITFQPTIPHCSQATLIGLLLLVKAQRAAAAASSTSTGAVKVSIIQGSHASYMSINKQLGDKERVRAAAANPSLKQMIDSGKFKP